MQNPQVLKLFNPCDVSDTVELYLYHLKFSVTLQTCQTSEFVVSEIELHYLCHLLEILDALNCVV
jgi:hypothetical protein